MDLIPAFFGLSAGALFGLLIHFQRRGLETYDPLVGAFISVSAMSIFLWVLSPLFIDFSWFVSKAALIFFLSGLFFPATAQVAQVFSIARVGPALTSAIGAFAPFFAAGPAIFLLGEPWGFQLIIGMLLMTIGLLLSAFSTKSLKRTWPVWVLLLPLGASLARGIIQPIIKIGLSDIPSPFFATLVLGSVSTFILAVILVLTNKTNLLLKSSKGLKWFTISGIINAFGILSINYAIFLGGVVIAAPLGATAPIWALLFGFFIFKNEQLNSRHIFIAILVVLGSILIVTR